ncbi:hypothetical protein B0I75DRAFT_128870, partial [Yarrowia lipolytica]
MVKLGFLLGSAAVASAAISQHNFIVDDIAKKISTAIVENRKSGYPESDAASEVSVLVSALMSNQGLYNVFVSAVNIVAIEGVNTKNFPPFANVVTNAMISYMSEPDFSVASSIVLAKGTNYNIMPAWTKALQLNSDYVAMLTSPLFQISDVSTVSQAIFTLRSIATSLLVELHLLSAPTTEVTIPSSIIAPVVESSAPVVESSSFFTSTVTSTVTTSIPSPSPSPSSVASPKVPSTSSPLAVVTSVEINRLASDVILTSTSIESIVHSTESVSSTVVPTTLTVPTDCPKTPPAQGLLDCIHQCTIVTLQIGACFGVSSCICPRFNGIRDALATCLLCGIYHDEVSQIINNGIISWLLGCNEPTNPCSATVTSSNMVYSTATLVSTVVSTHVAYSTIKVTTITEHGPTAGTTAITGDDGIPTQIITVAPTGPVATSTVTGPHVGTQTIVGPDGYSTERVTVEPSIHLDGSVTPLTSETPAPLITTPVTTKTVTGDTAGTEVVTGADGKPTEQVTVVSSKAVTSSSAASSDGTITQLATDSLTPLPATTNTVTGPTAGTTTITGTDGKLTEQITVAPTGPVTTRTVTGPTAGTGTVTGDDGLPTEQITVAPTGPVTTKTVTGPTAGTTTITGTDGKLTEQITVAPT